MALTVQYQATSIARDQRPPDSSVAGRGGPTAWNAHLVAAVALFGLLGTAALSYRWTRAPLYNPAGTIDPWLYTAMFVNFDHLYGRFADTYYASRLAWILPGRVAYSVLPVSAAYWVLHGLSFVGGVAAVFALCRRHVGTAAAVAGAGALALSPMYWNAQYWDYIDGVTLTYLAAGLYFGLPTTSGRWRILSLALAGAFFAAALTTNLFVVLIGVIYPVLYAFLQPSGPAGRWLSRAAKDGAAVVMGGMAVIVALGAYADAVGGRFLFFMPQVDLVRSPVVGASKLEGYAWVANSPRLLVPVFLLVTVTPLLVVGRGLPMFRFAAGATTGLTILTAVIYGWEFLAGGATLEVSYYFSYFAISIALAIASAAALVIGLGRGGRSRDAVLAVATTIAGVGALALIFYRDQREWTGRTGMWISIPLMCIGALLIAVIVLRRGRTSRVVAVLALGTVAFASHVAINTSSDTFLYSNSARDNGDLYRVGLDLVRFVNDTTKRGDWVPAFWYRAADRPDIVSIQSMYYYAYTYLGIDLPRVTKDLRDRFEQFEPERIVLLCARRDCGGAPAALQKAGYDVQRGHTTLIARGPIRVWVMSLRVTGGTA